MLPQPAQAAAVPAGGGVKRFVRQQVPDEILNDAALQQAIQVHVGGQRWQA
jgi:hypothetical protein